MSPPILRGSAAPGAHHQKDRFLYAPNLQRLDEPAYRGSSFRGEEPVPALSISREYPGVDNTGAQALVLFHDSQIRLEYLTDEINFHSPLRRFLPQAGLFEPLRS